MVGGWEAHLEMQMGNDNTRHIGSGGLVLHYMSTINEEDSIKGIFGYNSPYEGVAVVLNTMKKHRQTKDDEDKTNVLGFTNDGSGKTNYARKTENSCLADIKNNGVVKIKLEY